MNEINTETSPASQTILRPPNAGVVTKEGAHLIAFEADYAEREYRFRDHVPPPDGWKKSTPPPVKIFFFGFYVVIPGEPDQHKRIAAFDEDSIIGWWLEPRPAKPQATAAATPPPPASSPQTTDEKVALINQLILEVQEEKQKTRSTKALQLSPGGVLNAYREGDISFTEAENLLKNMRNPVAAWRGTHDLKGDVQTLRDLYTEMGHLPRVTELHVNDWNELFNKAAVLEGNKCFWELAAFCQQKLKEQTEIRQALEAHDMLSKEYWDRDAKHAFNAIGDILLVLKVIE